MAIINYKRFNRHWVELLILHHVSLEFIFFTREDRDFVATTVPYEVDAIDFGCFQGHCTAHLRWHGWIGIYCFYILLEVRS